MCAHLIIPARKSLTHADVNVQFVLETIEGVMPPGTIYSVAVAYEKLAAQRKNVSSPLKFIQQARNLLCDPKGADPTGLSTRCKRTFSMRVSQIPTKKPSPVLNILPLPIVVAVFLFLYIVYRVSA
jgi:hypothetical protein